MDLVATSISYQTCKYFEFPANIYLVKSCYTRSCNIFTNKCTLFFKYSRRDRGERTGKGLRHFSMRVCEKVKQKGRTSYNEVADELVNEYAPAPNGMTVDLVSCNFIKLTIVARAYQFKLYRNES